MAMGNRFQQQKIKMVKKYRFLRECPDFQPEFPRPGQTLVGTPNVPIFGSDVPLVETNFYHAHKCVKMQFYRLMM
jgi:hypothetical protein